MPALNIISMLRNTSESYHEKMPAIRITFLPVKSLSIQFVSILFVRSLYLCHVNNVKMLKKSYFLYKFHITLLIFCLCRIILISLQEDGFRFDETSLCKYINRYLNFLLSDFTIQGI